MTKIRSQQQLIDVSARIFAERGYEATRLEDIAAELGVLQGSLYYHVESKAALYRLVMRQRFASIVDTIEQVARSSAAPKAKLRKAIREQLRYIARYQQESPHWFQGAPGAKDEADADHDRELLRRFRGSWKSIVSECVSAGDARRNADPTIVVLSILGMTNYVARWFDPDGGASIDQIANAQFAIIWSGIEARPDGRGAAPEPDETSG
jgi:TetR/AcrR family transcriptional regulator, cholesterol catabolism regulator